LGINVTGDPAAYTTWPSLLFKKAWPETEYSPLVLMKDTWSGLNSDFIEALLAHAPTNIASTPAMITGFITFSPTKR
jgi:hypothetical protein